MPLLRRVESEAGTVAFAEELARSLPRGSVFAVHGDLGAGKTRFAAGVARALGVRDAVSSPTFALVHEHACPDGGRFLHLDLYRLGDESEVADLGFPEMLDHCAAAVIEWPERAGGLLPPATRHVFIALVPDAPDARDISVE